MYEREYYGNSTTYSGYYYNILNTYKVLIAHDILQTPKRSAVLIGGLPCSGKTTLAKESYSDHFLIDDPKEWKDIKKHLRKNKIVITDPYLSFKKNREDAITKLESSGYHVTVELLDVPKQTLKARAKKMDRMDRIEFIKSFKLEK